MTGDARRKLQLRSKSKKFWSQKSTMTMTRRRERGGDALALQYPLASCHHRVHICWWNIRMAMLSSSSSKLASLVASTRQSPQSSANILRWLSSKKAGGNNKGSSSFKAPRRPGKSYLARHQPKPLKKVVVKGPKEPYDITRRVPKIDLSKIEITDEVDAELEDDAWLDPLIAQALEQAQAAGLEDLDVETQLKMMDYFVSQPGSTEDLVGERRIYSLEQQSQAMQDQIEEMIHKERIDYLELPETDIPTAEEMEASQATGSARIPPNQLAHGSWGEMLIRTDRVCKMWRGGRIESYRALVIGGNLRGCGGFGVGKSFEPEDAVQIASRMARRNIFFVDRYRNRSLTRDLVGRQNSCKVYLRSTNNGLRGNPLSCEILKLMGITNAVCKAHGNRNHFNVVRATFKALQTHESLDEIALKRGVRLINLQKARHLQV